VALKVSAELLGEAETLAQLQHTHVVPIYSAHRSAPSRSCACPTTGRRPWTTCSATSAPAGDAGHRRGDRRVPDAPAGRRGPPPRRRGRRRRRPRCSCCGGWATSRRSCGSARGWPMAWRTPTSGGSSTAT
jgi:hypothetical protein